jgi:hypothetical protein
MILDMVLRAAAICWNNPEDWEKINNSARGSLAMSPPDRGYTSALKLASKVKLCHTWWHARRAN